MEQLIAEIEAYGANARTTPQKLLKQVVGANRGQWQKWKSGTSSPTMRVADRICEYSAEQPVQEPAEGDAA